MFSVQSKSVTTTVPRGYSILSKDVLDKLSEWSNLNPSKLISTTNGFAIYAQQIHQFQISPPVDNSVHTLFINLWLELLVAHHRDETLCIMGAHYYEQSLDYDGKKPILHYEKVFIPIYLNTHWVLAVVFRSQREIVCYDPLNVTGHTNKMLLDKLENLIKSDVKKRHGVEFDMSKWKMYSAANIPLQTQGNDSDVFVCAYAEALARNQRDFTFAEADLPYFRKRITYEIGTGQMLD